MGKKEGGLTGNLKIKKVFSKGGGSPRKKGQKPRKEREKEYVGNVVRTAISGDLWARTKVKGDNHASSPEKFPAVRWAERRGGCGKGEKWEKQGCKACQVVGVGVGKKQNNQGKREKVLKRKTTIK